VVAHFARAVFKRWLDIGHFTTILKQTTSMAHLGGDRFARLAFPVPSLSEQRQITAILDTIDDAIRKTEQITAKLKQVRQGLLHDLLTRGIDDNGELRDPERHPEQFKDSSLGRIPRDWQVEPTEQLTVAPICYGIVQAGLYVEGGPLVLTIGDLGGDFRSDLHRTSKTIERGYARSRTTSGDLLLSIKGTIGRIAVVPDWYEGNISRDLARLRFGSRVTPEFARHYFESPFGQRRLELSVVGTTRAEISIHVLKNLRLPVPSSGEQAGIVSAAAAQAGALREQEAAFAKLRLLKVGLMEDLLTGRVRVTPLFRSAPV
jgi:type I restriction enzyme S subunit